MTQAHRCNILAIEKLTNSVFQVFLEPETPMDFKAGQYLLIHMSDEDKRPFSIASAAYDNTKIELHIGADPENTYAYEVLTRLQESAAITVTGGVGEAYLRNGNEPIILIAGGTGFSYTYGILQQALAEREDADITLYWGSRKAEDFYLTDKLQALQDKHSGFQFIPVVEFPENNWHGRTGWVHHAVLSDYPQLGDQRIYIAGRFEMAKTARDDFFQRGLATHALFGDAYAFI